MGIDPMKLPIREHSQEVLDIVRKAPICIVIGETGSGKTTQLPQMLLDAGLAGTGAIAVTQPRRVAAITVARRVAEERGNRVGDEVGYVVRFDECSSNRTRIKYVTDGTLLRELLDDSELSKYSVVVLDEAHERSLNTDILFALMKQIAERRRDGFKVVVMSATLEAQRLSLYFDGCPVLKVPGRQFPVREIYAQENHTKDYQSAAVMCVVDIHVHQPVGDILVFFAGQAEILKAVRQITEEVANIPRDQECMDLIVLPLYAALPMELQTRVFSPPIPNCRRCIVATNIAETSITVDGVVYVVDPGMCKEKQYDPKTGIVYYASHVHWCPHNSSLAAGTCVAVDQGMERLAVQPISRVQATQRAGRAGRTQPGKCFRLYTQSYFEVEMPDTTAPEIQRTSLLGTVLHLKSLPLSIDVLSFDFVDPPARASLEEALRQLYILDALDSGGCITEIGKLMVQMPLDPSLSRALVAAVQLGCLPEMLAVSSLLSVENLFTAEAPRNLRDAREMARAEEHTRAHQELQRDGFGDHLFLLRLWECLRDSPKDRHKLEQLRVNARGFAFAEKVYSQLRHVVDTKIMPALTSPGRHRGAGAAGHDAHPRSGDAGKPRDGSARNTLEASGRRRDASGEGISPRRQRNVNAPPDDGARTHKRGRSESAEGNGRGREDDRDRRRISGQRRSAPGRDVGGHGDGDAAIIDADEESDRHAGRSSLVGRSNGHERSAGSSSSTARPGIVAGPRARDPITALRHALAIGFANRVANRMRMHNGYHTLNTNASAASIHPTASKMALKDGLFPPWIVYHEFVETSKPFLRNVCAIDADWVVPTLRKMQECDAQALSQANSGARSTVASIQPTLGQKAVAGADGARRADDLTVAAARARALVRRQNKASAGSGKPRK